MVSVINEILNPPKANWVSMKIVVRKGRKLTSIDRRNDCLHNDDRKSVKTAKLSDNLLHSRELSHHVQEHRHQGAEAEKDGSGNAISLSCPLSENEAFWTLSSDDRT